MTQREFNLKITSWKEELTGRGTASFAQGTELKIHIHYSGCYTNQLGSLGRQSVILLDKVLLYSLALFPSSLEGIMDFFLFSWEQISWPQVQVIMWTEEQTGQEPKHNFPPLHVPWHEMGCQEVFLSSLISCTEQWKTISKVWPAVEGISWLPAHLNR